MKIYCLHIGEAIIYVGQTFSLRNRKGQHLSSNPHFKDLPAWIKSMIQIRLIEECDDNCANKRELYWIDKYRQDGIPILNTKSPLRKIKPLDSAPILYKNLSIKEITFIRKYLYKPCIASLLPVSTEAIRHAIGNKKIKKAYYEKIFSGDNLLLYKQMHNEDHTNTKINLDS